MNITKASQIFKRHGRIRKVRRLTKGRKGSSLLTLKLAKDLPTKSLSSSGNKTLNLWERGHGNLFNVRDMEKTTCA
jgi:hypothetical protein